MESAATATTRLFPSLPALLQTAGDHDGTNLTTLRPDVGPAGADSVDEGRTQSPQQGALLVVLFGDLFLYHLRTRALAAAPEIAPEVRFDGNGDVQV